MTIMKISRHTDPYSRIKRDVLQDSRLSWRARGLLAYLLSLPENWEPHVNHLVKEGTDGRDAIYAIIKELRMFGYVEHIRERDTSGRVRGGHYIVYEEPRCINRDSEALLPEKPEEAVSIGSVPDPERPDLAKPGPAWPDVLDNKYIKNKTKINKETAVSMSVNGLTDSSAFLPKHYAAADYISETDTVIQSELTPVQLSHTRKLAKDMCGKLGVDEELLFKHLSITMLDSQYFTKAGKDFFKKYNSIRKAMLEGKWTPPSSLASEKLKKQQEVLDGIYSKINELIGNINHSKKMIESFTGDKAKEMWRREVSANEEKLKVLQEQLAGCQT